MNNYKAKQRGAVALFIVIFASILITTITVSFVRIMVQNQNQASTIDLSKSALDSALAGVEDAKRALIECRDINAPNLDACAAIDDQKCSTIQKSNILSGVDTDDEIVVQQKVDDEELQQAYSCVKITRNPPDYLEILESDAPKLVHLKGVKTFDSIVIEWFSVDDQRNTGPGSIVLENPGDLSLPRLSNWNSKTPPMVRAQLIQFNDGTFMSDFDKNFNDETNNATLFLKPSGSSIVGGSLDFADDKRQKKGTGPELVNCTNTSFYCKAEIKMPKVLNGGTSKRDAYLLISKIYGSNSTFRITLKDGTGVVKFSEVQSIVDSTGRANDLFRRVHERVEVGVNDIPSPESAVDLASSFCKRLELTDIKGADLCSY